MLLDLILLIAFIVVYAFQGVFMIVPLGNEDSIVRRLPWVTFAIIGLCVIIYFGTLPATYQQDRNYDKAARNLYAYLESNQEILADARVRDKLKESGVRGVDFEAIEEQIRGNPTLEARYKEYLAGADANKVRQELDLKLAAFIEAKEAHLYSKYGLGAPGQWKVYQLITYAFLHANEEVGPVVLPFHLIFNMLFFFAVAFTLEDLWGRALFAGFYLLAAVAAAVPDAVVGIGLIGASGAVFATLGAFLIRLPKTRLKVGWVCFPLALLFLMFGKKPFGAKMIPGYVIISYFFASQLLFWWFINYKLGAQSGVSFRCHIAGFIFGAAFAAVLKGMRVEESYINPKIESKVSFSAPPMVAQAMQMLDRGALDMAEGKLKAYLARDPNNLDGILGLIQVYHKRADFENLNTMYGRLIRCHLDRQDKAAALYAYDSLLSEFPEDQVEARIPARDWLTVCEHLREVDMPREAAVEYERLANAWPADPIAARACVQGGEAALHADDLERAARLFERGLAMNPVDIYQSRLRLGLEKCQKRLGPRQGWQKPTTGSVALKPKLQP